MSAQIAASEAGIVKPRRRDGGVRGGGLARGGSRGGRKSAADLFSDSSQLLAR